MADGPDLLQRIGELVFNKSDRSIWGLRHLSGYVSLVRIPYPYEEWDLVHTFPYGTVVYDMDISADGAMLSGSFGDVEGQQSLKIFTLDDLLAELLQLSLLRIYLVVYILVLRRRHRPVAAQPTYHRAHRW